MVIYIISLFFKSLVHLLWITLFLFDCWEDEEKEITLFFILGNDCSLVWEEAIKKDLFSPPGRPVSTLPWFWMDSGQSSLLDKFVVMVGYSFKRMKLIDLSIFWCEYDRRIIFLRPLSLTEYTPPLYWDTAFGKYTTIGENYAKESSSLN